MAPVDADPRAAGGTVWEGGGNVPDGSIEGQATPDRTSLEERSLPLAGSFGVQLPHR